MHADEPHDQQAEIDTFWDEARRRARLDWLPGFGAVTPVAALQPPAWSFGATLEQADALLELVLNGTKTATASLLSDYDAEEDPVPEVGTMGIVLDGAGHPRALVATTAVRIVEFDRVPAEHAHAEGEGDRSLDYWRRVHREFFSTHSLGGAELPGDAPVVLEEFRLLYPEPPRQD
ncbi:ASCH domain-containing protein [Enemella sp. A6]